jgi:hypothetical protein
MCVLYAPAGIQKPSGTGKPRRLRLARPTALAPTTDWSESPTLSRGIINVPDFIFFSTAHYSTETMIDKADADGTIIVLKIVELFVENSDNVNQCLSETAAYVRKVKEAIENLGIRK